MKIRKGSEKSSRNYRFQPINWMKNMWYRISEMSFAKHIVIFYLLITVLGSVLLFIPATHANNQDVEYIDALFVAASAFSDTGLSPVNVAYTFNMFGQAVIAILIFLGGIGWFALKLYIFNILLGRPLTYLQRQTLSAERGDNKFGVTRELIKVAVTTLLILTVFASVALTLIFYFEAPDTTIAFDPLHPETNVLVNNPQGDVWMSLRMGVFHSISAINNAGFDIIGANSLAPYYDVYSIQIVFMVLFIVGGIGYPVIYDLNAWIRARHKGHRFQFSLFTKLSMTTYAIVSLVGLATVFSVELTAQDSFWANPTDYGTDGNKIMALFFNTMSTRNAGFSTISMHDLSRATLIIFSIMMFIGSAPSSTAGGIRTTTFAIIILGIWARLRGRSNVYAFGKRIPTDTVNRSYVVLAVSLFLVMITVCVGITSFDTHGGQIPSTAQLLQDYRANGESFTGLVNAQGVPYGGQSYYDFTEMIFECASAFGTTGLSAGITSMLSIPTMIFMIFLMFFGQIGISSSIFAWGNRKSGEKHYSRVKEDVTIG